MERVREHTVHTNGVDLGVAEFGAESGPGILLLAGMASSSDWWDDAFCEALAEGGRRVVRYDYRDTGSSTASPPGRPDYDGNDLVNDVVELVRILGLAPVHLAGISFGGGLAQQIAFTHPEIIATLTLMSTSPGDSADRDPLPPPTARLIESWSSPGPDTDWTDRTSVREFFLQGEELYSGTIPVDRDRIVRIADRVFARTANLATANNHMLIRQPDGTRSQLRDVTLPTLVVHGTDDPLLPFPHGEALAAEIPGARLLPVPGMGHQNPPPETWPLIVPAIREHTATSHPD
jgi:pimeloyl-ACP methyl ester carboxylesterase